MTDRRTTQLPDAAAEARTRLVLVHGSRLSGTQWAPQIPLLATEFDVVTPDLPGHGTSLGEAFTLERAVGAIAAAVDGPEPPAYPPTVLVGHSLGGYVAMAYAHRFPRRLCGLVLAGAAAVPTGPGAALYRGVARATTRAGEERMRRLTIRVLTRLYAAEVTSAVLAGGYAFAPTQAAWLEVMAACRPSMLRDVCCPVLLLGGQFDQLHLGARRLARACRDGRVQTIRAAGHLANLDQPVTFADAVRRFAREVC